MARPAEKIVISHEALRVLIFYEFRLGSSTRQAADRINQAMGQGTTSRMTVDRWYQRFRDGDADFEDAPRTGRPTSVDVDVLKELVEEDPRQSSRCLAERLQVDHTTVLEHLHGLGKRWKYAAWIPHQLTGHQLQLRADICLSHLTSHANDDWLNHVVTGDEKWVLYVNDTHKRQWLGAEDSGVPTARRDGFSKKTMLCCWWNSKGVIHWELMPSNSTVNSDVYCTQLEAVARKLRGKQRKVHLLHDNARPHISSATRNKILELGWTTVAHPPYSPDLAPSDYHLFRSLAHHLEEKRFDNDEQVKTCIQAFFDLKPPEFYKRGIHMLPERWRSIVDSNGAYILD